MKLALSIMGLFLALNTHARSVRMPEQATVEGQVKFTKSFTVTCMAIGCPPSKMYYKFELVNSSVEGLNSEVVTLEITDVENDGTPYSRGLVYGGARLREGMRVQMTGDVQTRVYRQRAYVYFSNPKKVKILRNYF